MGGGMRGGGGVGVRPPMGGTGGRGPVAPPGGGRGFVGSGLGHNGAGFHAPSIGFGNRFVGTGAFYGGWGGWGWGLGWGVGNYGCPYSYPCSSYVTYPYVGGYWPGYSDVPMISYTSPAPAQSGVTVVYPGQAFVERAHPVTHEYDASGREILPQASSNASPIYLFAFGDQTIRAASSYRVEGQTLHYVTIHHEEKQAPFDSLDRELTLQLNRERNVSIRLP